MDPYHEGGRLSTALLMQHADRLREVFGYNFTEADLRRTTGRPPMTIVARP